MRVVAWIAVCLAACLGLASGATAQVPGDLGDQDSGSIDADVDSLGEGEYVASLRYGAERGSIGASDRPCVWALHDYLSYQLWWQAFAGAPSDEPPLTEDDPDPDGNFDAAWVIVYCSDGAGLVDYLDGFQVGDPPDPVVLVEHARRRLSVPLPVAAFSPDAAIGAPQVVGLETWVWVDPADTADLSVTACVPDTGAAFACATVDARFLDTGFAMGDDSAEFFCSGAGTPFDVSRSYESQADLDHCAHVYLEADRGGSTYDAVATTFWHITWTCSYDADLDGTSEASCGGGDLGVVGRSQAPVPLDVLDLQARAVAG